MLLADKIKRLWNKAEGRLIGSKKYFFLSPSHYSLYHDAFPFFKKYVRATVVDIGAGRLGWKFLAEKFSSSYISADIKKCSGNQCIVADGKAMPFKDNSVNTVLCLQVLEHSRDPGLIFREISRIIQTGGYVVISFPHMSYIHSEPEDYFRFTVYGLKSICPEELEVEIASESGGLLCFVFTPVFILYNSLFSQLPLVRTLAWGLSAILSVFIFWVDKFLGAKKLYPLNYIVALRKTQKKDG